MAFRDPSFNNTGWTTESNNVGSQSQTGNGETSQLTATFTSGVAGYYRIVKTLSTPIDGNLYSKAVVRLKSSVAKNLLRVELKDGSTYFDPTDGAGDLWKKSTTWTTAILNLQGHSSINQIKLGISSETDLTISGAQSGSFDYAFIANDVPASQEDGLGQYSGVSSGGYQEKVTAWSSINRTDISLQARVFVGQRVNATDARVGLFTHYQGTGMNKWALVIHNATSGVKLSLLEEFVAWRVENACAVTTKNWYTLNFTLRGVSATGWLSGPNGLYCTVSGTFGGGALSTATGFGLYAGGYSALFDNVLVATVSPFITGTGFSNSFISNGAPGANIHGVAAGIAELQNGTASPPIETYYSYYSWGGVNQQKNRFEQTPATDASAIAHCPNTTNSCSVTLSTTRPNDIIIVFAHETLDLQTSCTFTISDTAGLAWTARTGIVYGRNNRDQLQEFWAKASAVLTSVTITESISGCGNNYNGLQVVAISGANFNSPFDPSGGVPGTNSGNSGPTSATITTSSPSAIVIAGVQHGSLVAPVPQFGFTGTTSGLGYGTEFKPATGVLTNYAVTFDDSVSDYWQEIADAVQPASGTQWTTQWRSSSRSYDTYGNPKTYTDPKGYTTYYTYSANYTYAYLTNETRLDGIIKVTTLYAYNFTTGNLRIVTDPKGNATSYQNDNLGRIKKTTYPLGAFTQNTYSDLTNPNYVDVTNENGRKTRQIYDGLGRQTVVDRFLGSTSYANETVAYNWQNNQLNKSDALGNVYRFGYDVLGRTVNATTPNGKTNFQLYNDIASWVRFKDEDGNYRCGVYDRQGHLISVLERADLNCVALDLNGYSYVTNYYYDEVGNLRRLTNAASRSTHYGFDNLSQLGLTAHPDKTFETYTYDNNGNLANSTNRNGIKTMRGYDSLNRVKTTTYCGTSITSTSLTYDKNSKPLTIQNENATITYGYDARDRLLSEKYEVNLASRQITDLGCSGAGGTFTVTGGVSKTYTIAHSYNGEVLDVETYPTLSITNIGVKYAYDGLGRVLNLTKSGTSTYYARSFTYDKNDRVKGLEFGNGLIGNYTYDNLGRPSTITVKNGGTTLLSLTYAYNNTGTIATVTGQVNQVTVNEQYKYDALKRLTNSTVTSQGTTSSSWYEYDNLGNRVRQKLNSAITTYTYNQTNNELNSYSAPGLNVAYTYNNDGTLKTRTITTNSTTWTYTWNVSGYLLKVARSGVNQGLYAYDGLGRQAESIEAATSFYAYTGTEILFKNISGSYSIDYLYAGGQRLATVDSSSGSYSTVKYFHVDHLGSTRLVTSSSASVVFANSYQPFGQDNGAATGSNTDKFTGKTYVTTTGLYYYYQRWYEPSIGRFISVDPNPGRLSDPQSLNPYVYVANNPVQSNDPTGECPWCMTALIGAVAGGLIEWGYCAYQAGSWSALGSNKCIAQGIIGAGTGALTGATFGLMAPESASISILGKMGYGALSGTLGGAVGFDVKVALGLEEPTVQNFVLDLSLGAVTGAIGGALDALGSGAGRVGAELNGAVSELQKAASLTGKVLITMSKDVAKELAKEFAADVIDPIVRELSGAKDQVVALGNTVYTGATQVYKGATDLWGTATSFFKWP